MYLQNQFTFEKFEGSNPGSIFNEANISVNEGGHIALLSERFVKEVCEDYGIPRKTISPKAIQELQKHNWTGNIRELRNVIERLIILSEDKITELDVRAFASIEASAELNNGIINKFEKFQDFKDFMEKLFIENKLKKNNWNVSKTSEEIDIQRSHLYNKIEKYKLIREQG